ncbi:MAG: C40 family peptidase [Acidimicrobiales bacterium]
MNTCTGIFRRHAWRLAAVVVAAGLLASTALPTASADPISNDRAKAQALADQIQALGLKEAALGEQYDKAVLAEQTTASQLGQQQAAVNAANASAAKARSAIQADAVNAYVNGGSLTSLAGQNQPSDMGQADGGLLANEYLNTLASTQTDNLDAFHSASLNARIATNQLQTLQKQQQAAVASTNEARNAASASQAQLQATLSQVKGDLANLVAQAQAAQAAVAAQAAAARLAADVSAALPGQASQAGQSSQASQASQASKPVPVGAGASEAVAAALSRIGDPYVWGAAGPNEFDCSGLVMWAWAQAGVSLPHFSGAQYASAQHIPMSELAPGDLVFFGDPGEHVAMYIGGGMIVEAPHTGADVQRVPLYGEFVLAARV